MTADIATFVRLVERLDGVHDEVQGVEGDLYDTWAELLTAAGHAPSGAVRKTAEEVAGAQGRVGENFRELRRVHAQLVESARLLSEVFVELDQLAGGGDEEKLAEALREYVRTTPMGPLRWGGWGPRR